jgi:hypothetical protein
LGGTRTAAPLTAKLFTAGTPLAGKVFRPVKRFICDERLRNAQKGLMGLRRAIVSAASQPLSFWPPVLGPIGPVRKGHSRSASETPPGSALWQGSVAVPVRQDGGYGGSGLASSCSYAIPFAAGARSAAKIWRIRSSRPQTNSPENPNKFFIFFVVVPHCHEVEDRLPVHETTVRVRAITDPLTGSYELFTSTSAHCVQAGALRISPLLCSAERS